MSLAFCRLCACFDPLDSWKGICYFPYWVKDGLEEGQDMAVIVKGNENCPHFKNEPEFVAELRKYHWYASVYGKEREEGCGKST